MSEMSPKSAETILPESWKATVGEETFTIRTFALAKVIKAFALIGELIESAKIDDVVKAAADSAEAGEFEQDIAPGFVTKALLAIPKALREGSPAVYKLIGLIVTPNSKLRAMDEGDEDIDAHLLHEGRRLAYEGTTEQIVNLFSAAVQAIGVETILAQLPNLMRVFAR